MTAPVLLVEFLGTAVRLAIVSAPENSALVVDGVGRHLIPLDAAVLWSDYDLGIVHEQARLVADFVATGSVEAHHHDALSDALVSLFEGMRQLGESRILHGELNVMTVLVRVEFTAEARQLIAKCAEQAGVDIGMVSYRRAALQAYGVDLQRPGERDAVVVDVEGDSVGISVFEMDGGVLELLATSQFSIVDYVEPTVRAMFQAALSSAELTSELIDECVLIMKPDSPFSDKIHTVIKDVFPSATLHQATLSNDTHFDGAIQLLQKAMARPARDPSERMCILDPLMVSVGVETMGGRMAPLVRRHRVLPTATTSWVQVHCASDPEFQDFIDLRFFEGESVSVEHNTFIGSLRLEGLRVGWNEIQIRVLVDSELTITFAASTGFGSMIQLTTKSPTTRLSWDELVPFLNRMESLSLARELDKDNTLYTAVEMPICRASRGVTIWQCPVEQPLAFTRLLSSERCDDAPSKLRSEPIVQETLEKSEWYIGGVLLLLVVGVLLFILVRGRRRSITHLQ